MRSALERVRACASVFATTKSTPWRPASIMLLTALPPAPPTPKTVIRGLSSRTSGILRLIVMACLFMESASRAPSVGCLCGLSARVRPAHQNQLDPGLRNGLHSETVFQPSADSGHVAVRAGCQASARGLRLEVLDPRDLRINEEADRRGERRALRRLGQPGDAEGTSDADLPIEDLPREVGNAGELAGAPGQNHPPSRFSPRTGGLEAVAHQLED